MFTIAFKMSVPGEKCTLDNKLAFYADIMLDVFAILLCATVA